MKEFETASSTPTWKSTIAKVSNFGPEEPTLLEGYTPNAPVITFNNGMTLQVGDHTSK